MGKAQRRFGKEFEAEAVRLVAADVPADRRHPGLALLSGDPMGRSRGR